MTTVWKYPLRLADGVQVLNMPRGARLLSAHDQQGTPTLWMLVDAANPVEERRFVVHGTGHPVSLPMDDAFIDFVGSCHDAARGLVWHVFEVAA